MSVWPVIDFLTDIYCQMWGGDLSENKCAKKLSLTVCKMLNELLKAEYS